MQGSRFVAECVFLPMLRVVRALNYDFRASGSHDGEQAVRVYDLPGAQEGKGSGKRASELRLEHGEHLDGADNNDKRER